MYLNPIGQQRATLMEIPSGEPGILQTLREMARIAKQFKTDVRMRQLVAQLFRDANLAQGDFLGEVCVLHAFVRDTIRYMGDVHDVETLQDPNVTLQNESGDCDDKCILLATLLECCNHPARFMAVGMNGRGFSHVFVETWFKRCWIALETCRSVKAGWRPSNISSRMKMYI
ncbi:MAG TPA: transglutaminase family protein [Steroidobacteraceae bacterium]|nr:transglutaminase family protein [Steroidobacteraceae bacterium]